MSTPFATKYPTKCGVKHTPAPIKENKGVLLSALKVWESKNGYGQSPITKSATSLNWMRIQQNKGAH